jgi:hypothetical protein
MQGLPKTQRSAVKRACWSLGCGGASFLGTVAIMHGPSAPLAIAVGTGAAVASHAIAELSSALPGIIAALSAKKVARIKAKTDAKVALEGARRRTALVNAGLEGNLDAAVSLLKLQVLDAQLPAGRRLSEDLLRELLPGPRAPQEEDPRLAAVQPRKPSTAARHAKADTQPTSPLPVDATRPQLAGPHYVRGDDDAVLHGVGAGVIRRSAAVLSELFGL